MGSVPLASASLLPGKARKIFLLFAALLLFSLPCYGSASESMLSAAKEPTDEEPAYKEPADEEPDATEEKIRALSLQLEQALPVENGTWAVYVQDLVTEEEASINDTSMQAASLIKLYIMGTVYENYETLTERYGQSEVDSYLYSMITVSDNDASNTLVTWLGSGDSAEGMSMVNDFCLAHGFTASHMGRLLLHSNEFGDNYTSVADCGHFLTSIYKRDTEEFPYAESMFTLLSCQTRRHKIPAQLPPEVSVANKTGELADVENDAGIIYDTSNDLVLVFMSENLTSVGSAQDLIASLSRQIYDFYH